MNVGQMTCKRSVDELISQIAEDKLALRELGVFHRLSQTTDSRVGRIY